MLFFPIDITFDDLKKSPPPRDDDVAPAATADGGKAAHAREGGARIGLSMEE